MTNKENVTMEYNEPTLKDMDDYDGKEPAKKKKTILLIIASLLLIGILLSMFGANTAKIYILDTLPKTNSK